MQCPLAAITLTVEKDTLTVEPLFATYSVTDCVGESDEFTTVIDIPADLRREAVELLDPEGQVAPVKDRKLLGREVLAAGINDATVPAAVHPRIGETSPTGQLRLGWVSSGCGQDSVHAGVLVLDDLAVPLVRVPSSCRPPATSSGTWPMPDRVAGLEVLGAS